MAFEGHELWFYTGSQHLYGPEALDEVAKNSTEVANGLDASSAVPVKIVFRKVLTTAAEISAALREANGTPECIGVITWMHTFSPAKMWIDGLLSLRKPLLHLHTQYGRDIPWADIDMDYMNLHQAAHGDREFGYIGARLGVRRKVVVGHWKSERVQERVGAWARAAAAWADQQGARIARFGDNMRNVAVTEGNKVSAQVVLGYAVDGYGASELAERVHAASDAEVDAVVSEYEELYDVASELRKGGDRHDALRYAAKQEVGLRGFLTEGGFIGYTDTFENLSTMDQLPGVGSQRMMAHGFGFGAEGDWKTAALVRAVKVMGTGLPGGTSFMEDYTYHLESGRERVLGAHMLEICPSIAAEKPKVEVHPLGIGGKSDPVRLVFTTPPGPGLNATLLDMGDRFRLLVNEVDVVAPDAELPKLPVASAVWVPRPDLEVAAAAWIYAGGAHHTAFTQSVTTEMLEDYATIAGIELAVIDADTRIRQFRQELRTNEVYYRR